MKKLKSFYVLLLCVLLTVLLLAAQLFYCADATLLASRHVSRLLENQKQQQALLELLVLNIREHSVYGSTALENTDQDYIRSQLYILLKDFHQYLISNTDTLPTIYIAPLKPAIKEYILQEALAQPQTQDKISKVQTILNTLNNKYFNALLNFSLNNQVISGLLQLTPVKNTGFDRSTVSQILSIYLSFSQSNISIEEASRSIVEKMTSEALQLDSIKDYFDTGMFAASAFGEKQPLLALKELIRHMDSTLSYFIPFAGILLLVLLLCSGVKSLFWRLRAVFACSSMAALLALLLSPFFLFRGLSSTQSFFSGLLNLLLRDYGWHLLFTALLTLGVSIGLYICFRRFIKENSSEKKKTFLLPRLRLSLVLILLLFITGWWSIDSIKKELLVFNTELQEFHQTDHRQDIWRALGDTIGIKLQKK